MKKLFENIKNIYEMKRVQLGLSLSIAASINFIFMIDVDGKEGMYGFGLNILNAIVFILGLLLITRSMDIVSKIFTRVAKETIALVIVFMAAQEVMFALKQAYGDLNGFHPILLLFSLVVLVWYVLRICMILLKTVKKVLINIISKIKDKKDCLQSLDDVLKNIASIISTITSLKKL